MTVNNGVGFNPLCFSSLNDPELGTTWNVQVDTTAFTNVQWTAVWGRVGNGGSVLLRSRRGPGGPAEPGGHSTRSRAEAESMVHSHAIPNNPALAGQNWVVQGSVRP